MAKVTYILGSSFIAIALLGGCASDAIKNDEDIPGRREQRYKDIGKLFGDDTFAIGPKAHEEEPTSGIGVNSYLWRAALDTISFMPLKSADPFGGVILTEWYSPPATPNERFKIDIRILDRQLRADGVKVSIFKQDLQGNQWIDMTIDTQRATDIEDAILTRARQIKMNM
ncbi:DUF3576 domain-containing protein [Candidatus Nucleicultrix amoebiphila]|jgi:hypothetical protein|nr:DUF3576 domain-containing protein [Candidatus Nucleicultrix amoebiphila]